MSKKNASAIESGAGYFQGFITAMMDIARDNKVPFEAVYRLAKPEGRATLAKMIGVANADYELASTSSDDKSDDKFLPRNKMNSASAPLPASDDIRIFVDYKMPTSKKMLERVFSQYGVSRIFFEKDVTWKLDTSFSMYVTNPTSRDFLIKHFDKSITTKQAIFEMKQQGYRPAIHLEAFAFAKTYREMNLNCIIIALGSFVQDDRHIYYAMLNNFDQFRFEIDSCLEWNSEYRFLFVRM